jgi:predicted TIM-barrel fold metal-dependent hydrolase
MIDFVSRHKNVYLDFLGNTIYPSVFKIVLDKAEKGKILYGTDMPMMDIS